MTHKLDPRSEKIRNLDTQIYLLETARKEVIKDSQIKCMHEDTAECNYMGSRYGSPSPPIRMCCKCGMTEDGWGSGYLVLKDNYPRTITRDDIYKLRLGLKITEYHKTDLIQGTYTLEELITREG